MKTTAIKNIAIFAAGATLAVTTGLFAASIDANITSFSQYIQNLFITSDGTPSGIETLHIRGDGEFTQTRGDVKIINTESISGGGGFVGSIAQTGDLFFSNGIQDISIYPTQSYQSVLGTLNIGTNHNSFIATRENNASLGVATDYTSGDTRTQIEVTPGTIKFEFPGNKYYIFPTTPGQPNQVLTTDGQGQLAWNDTTSNGLTESIVTDKISFSAQDIANLHETPIQLIPAPGEGKYIKVLGVDARFVFGTTPYPSNPWISVYMISVEVMPGMFTSVDLYKSDSMNMSSFFTIDAGNKIIDLEKGNGSPRIIENHPVFIKLSNDPNAMGPAGDGTLDIYITYKVVNL